MPREPEPAGRAQRCRAGLASPGRLTVVRFSAVSASAFRFASVRRASRSSDTRARAAALRNFRSP